MMGYAISEAARISETAEGTPALRTRNKACPVPRLGAPDLAPDVLPKPPPRDAARRAIRRSAFWPPAENRPAAVQWKRSRFSGSG